MATAIAPTVLFLELEPAPDGFGELPLRLEQAGLRVRHEKQTLGAMWNDNWLGQVLEECQALAVALLVGRQVFPFVSTVRAQIPLSVPVILVAEALDPSQIQSAVDLGFEVVVPPFTSDILGATIWRHIRRHRPERGSRRGNLFGEIDLQRLGLLGRSPLFLSEIQKLRPIARCDVTVLITGETGTGKELIARAIHYESPRCKLPFIPIDCAALPPELAESELFGHERGAFTGAVVKTPGLMATANGGTILLDEVDSLPLSVQAKLLRFLQQKEYRCLGSSEMKKSDVRVISATNCNLQQKVRDREFREDLYYRLNVANLRLPALRERSEDVPLLAQHFAAKYATKFNRPTSHLSSEAVQRLLSHAWPGNVRELENVLEATIALCEGPVVTATDLVLTVAEPDSHNSFREAKARAVKEFEQNYIVRLLRAHGGNISEAARAAKKNRRAFWELIRRHRINAGDFRDDGRGAPAESVVVAARRYSSFV